MVIKLRDPITTDDNSIVPAGTLMTIEMKDLEWILKKAQERAEGSVGLILWPADEPDVDAELVIYDGWRE